jgi:hypothetical protein
MIDIASFAEKLGVLEAIKGKITPEPAAQRLVKELKSLLEPYVKINDPITRFLGLSFEGAPAEAQTLHEIIDSIEGGPLPFEVTSLKGHCQTIMNLFERDLRPWFVAHEPATKVPLIEETFRELSDFHEITIREVEELVRWLGHKCRGTETLLQNKEYEAANRLVRESRIEIRARREAIVASMQKVLALEDKFRQASKAV